MRPPNYVDIIGKKINGMTVLSEFEKDEKWVKYLNVKCHCGKEKVVLKYFFRSGKVKSCGCKGRNRWRKTDNYSDNKLYIVHRGMLARCNNPNVDKYKNYGGRGIKVCDEWSGKGGFLNFQKWSFDNGYKEGQGLSIDRINVDGNYSPENCRYADAKTQGRNKRNNWYEYYKGEKRLVVELCEELNLDYHLIQNRKRKGKTGDELFKPKMIRNKNKI